MPQHESIHDLADRAVSEPSALKEPDIVRLGSWVVDRQEHIDAHRAALAEASGQTAPTPKSDLMKRLGPAPVSLDAPKTVEDHVDLADKDDPWKPNDAAVS